MGNRYQSLLPVAEKWDLGHILAALQRLKDRDGQVDWDIHYLDGTLIRAHQHAAEAKKVGWERKHEAAVGGFGTKVHLRAEGGGKLLTWVWTAGERHEMRVAEQVMQQGQ